MDNKKLTGNINIMGKQFMREWLRKQPIFQTERDCQRMSTIKHQVFLKQTKVEVHKSMDGIKTGGRTKGTPNKITNEVKERLENLIDGLVSSLDINDLNPNQRIKLLQIALQYTLPRLQATVVKNETEDLPLFIEDIVIHTRKENSDEPEWKDNFEAKSLVDMQPYLTKKRVCFEEKRK